MTDRLLSPITIEDRGNKDRTVFDFLTQVRYQELFYPDQEVIRFKGIQSATSKRETRTVERKGINGKSKGRKRVGPSAKMDYSYADVPKRFTHAIQDPIRIKDIGPDAVNVLQIDEPNITIKEMATLHKVPTNSKSEVLADIADNLGIERFICINRSDGVRTKINDICGIGVNAFLNKVITKSGISLGDQSNFLQSLKINPQKGVLKLGALFATTGKRKGKDVYVSEKVICSPESLSKSIRDQFPACTQLQAHIQKEIVKDRFNCTPGIPQEYDRVCPRQIAPMKKSCENQAYIYLLEATKDLLLC